MRTLYEIKDLLATLDEVTLLEVLNLRSADLVERFGDYIEADLDHYERELEQWFPYEDDPELSET